MAAAMRQRYVVLAWVALLWAIGNAVYVYVLLNGERTFRVESAAFILVGVLLPLVFWCPSPPEPAPALTATDNRLLIVGALGLWLLTLVPHLRLPFLSDDYVFLSSYRQLSDVFTVRQFFRPVFALLFVVLSRVGHRSPAAFHVAALLVHGMSAWSVYVLSRRLFGRTDAAAFCFAIFLLNPLQLEAVLWVSGLQELLWTLFVLVALVIYTGAQVLSVARILATLLLIALAMLSKETAVSSVLLLPAADWALFRMRRGRLLAAAYVGGGVVAAAYLAARSSVVTIESTFYVAPGKYFAQKFVGTPYKFFVQPWNLTAVMVPLFVLCAATVLAFTVLFLAVLRGAGAMVFAGPAVILISTLPVYAYFYVAPDLRATRYLYFAAIGWALLVTQLLATVLARRWSRLAAFASFTVASFVSLQVNALPWGIAGEIVDAVAAAIRAGKAPEASADDWRARYGSEIEVKDGIPTVYKGVYLFVNGYPELRAMLTTSTPIDLPPR